MQRPRLKDAKIGWTVRSGVLNYEIVKTGVKGVASHVHDALEYDQLPLHFTEGFEGKSRIFEVTEIRDERGHIIWEKYPKPITTEDELAALWSRIHSSPAYYAEKDKSGAIDISRITTDRHIAKAMFLDNMIEVAIVER